MHTVSLHPHSTHCDIDESLQLQVSRQSSIDMFRALQYPYHLRFVSSVIDLHTETLVKKKLGVNNG